MSDDLKQRAEKAEARIAGLETAVAGLSAQLMEALNLCEDHIGSTCDNDYEIGQVDAYEAVATILGGPAPAEVVRVTVGAGGVLLTPAASISITGQQQAGYVMRVDGGDYLLVKLGGDS